jgi:hypothetical protein
MNSMSWPFSLGFGFCAFGYSHVNEQDFLFTPYWASHMINWAYFPRSDKATTLAKNVVKAFCTCETEISSNTETLPSNEVLSLVAPYLQALDFAVETGKKKSEKISIPVLYGNNGSVDKSFDADAYHSVAKFVVEVEAGRALVNFQFLKDLFQACMMDDG